MGRAEPGTSMSPTAGLAPWSRPVSNPGTGLKVTNQNFVTHTTGAMKDTVTFDFVGPAVGTGDITFSGSFIITRPDAAGCQWRQGTVSFTEGTPGTLPPWPR